MTVPVRTGRPLAPTDRRRITKPAQRRRWREGLYSFLCPACDRRHLHPGPGTSVGCRKCGTSFVADPVFELYRSFSYPQGRWRIVDLRLTRLPSVWDDTPIVTLGHRGGVPMAIPA